MTPEQKTTLLEKINKQRNTHLDQIRMYSGMIKHFVKEGESIDPTVIDSYNQNLASVEVLESFESYVKAETVLEYIHNCYRSVIQAASPMTKSTTYYGKAIYLMMVQFHEVFGQITSETDYDKNEFLVQL